MRYKVGDRVRVKHLEQDTWINKIEILDTMSRCSHLTASIRFIDTDNTCRLSFDDIECLGDIYWWPLDALELIEEEVR